MPTSILMPSLSPTMEEGVLAKWLVKEGDLIKPGTMLCSVETDKTTVDYESLDEGYLRKILVPSGSPAKVNQLIAILTDEKDEDFSAYLEKALKKSQDALAAKGAPVAATAPAAAAPAQASVSALSNGAPRSAAPAATAVAEKPASAGAADGRVKVSPLARKMAEEAGIPLQALTGSGPMGRIVKRDVEGYTPPPVDKVKSAADAVGKKVSEALVQRPLFGSLAQIAPTQDVVLNMMRKTIGRRLLESSQSMPVFYVTSKIQVDTLNTLREHLNRVPGYKVSVNDLIVKATAFALRQLPTVNSSFHGDFIRQNANIDICVAVSIDGGLITPIVRNVDQKGLGLISKEIKELVAKAKAGKLAPEEYQGGTFTISNLGMYGVDEFTAIINPPQAAILAVGGIQSELYKDGEAIKERNVMKVTLSSDHRVIDGALAAQFLSALKSILENPVSLML